MHKRQPSRVTKLKAHRIRRALKHGPTLAELLAQMPENIELTDEDRAWDSMQAVGAERWWEPAHQRLSLTKRIELRNLRPKPFRRRLVRNSPMTIKSESASPITRLVEEHPRLFRGEQPAVPSELPAGWYDLVHVLCLGIEDILGDDCAEFKVKQIKERLGELRFYFSLSDAEDLWVDCHHEGGFDTVVKRASPAPAKMDAVRQFVELSCEASRATCQVCGSFGSQHVIGGRLGALCDEHRAAELAELERRERSLDGVAADARSQGLDY